MQRHHMGISGIRSKQLRAPYGVSQARWGNDEFNVAVVGEMKREILNMRESKLP